MAELAAIPHSDSVSGGEADFRATFELAPVGIAHVALDGRWLRINPKLAEIVGYPPEELLQLTFQDITHPDDLAEDLEYVRRLVAGEIRSYSMEKRYIRKPGDTIWIRLTVTLLRDADGRPMHFIAVVEDIQSRKETEALLREARLSLEERVAERTAALTEANERFRHASARHQAILSALPDLVFLNTREGVYVDHHATQPELLLVPPEQFLGRNVKEVLPPELGAACLAAFAEAVRTGAIQRVEYPLTVGGRPCHFEARMVPCEEDKVFTIVRDITRRKRAEEKTRQQKRLLHLFVEHAPVSVAMFDREMRYLVVSRRWYEDNLMPGANIVGRNHYEVFPHLRDDWREVHRRGLAGEAASCEEDSYVRPDGTREWIRWEVLPWHDTDGAVGGIILFTDFITDRKRAADQVLASLREKEVLLREVHHRVKNNLQIISSLLQMQTRQTADLRVARSLAESQHRVQTMALIHEQLYQTPDMAGVDLSVYLGRLVDMIVRSHTTPAKPVHLNVEVAAVAVEPDLAMPVGLIVNELVTNALKHAFRGLPAPGTLSLRLRCEHARFELRVADDGVGLPPSVNWRAAETLGLRLVRLLAGQLGASLDCESGPGTVFLLTFAVPPA